MGGILPGVMLSAMFIAYILIRCIRDPKVGPPAENVTWSDRWTSLVKLLPIVIIGLLMILSLYTGIASTSEIAAIGCLGAFLVGGVLYRGLNYTSLKGAFLSTARTTAFLMWILVAAHCFGNVISFMQLPMQFATWIGTLNYYFYH